MLAVMKFTVVAGGKSPSISPVRVIIDKQETITVSFHRALRVLFRIRSPHLHAATCLIAVLALCGQSGCGSSSGSSSPRGNDPSAVGRVVYAGKYYDMDGILTMNPDGTGHKLVSPRFWSGLAYDVSFSPDESKVLFKTISYDFSLAQPTWRYDLWVMNADGSNSRTLFGTTKFIGTPSFSPDGSKIIFAGNQDGEIAIHLADVNHGGTASFARGRGYTNASYTPDGSRIVVEASRDGKTDSFLINTDGTGESLLLADASQVSFSEDGQRLVFCRERQVYVANRDGTRQTRLTEDNGFAPSFSPDTTKIIFNSNRNENCFGDQCSGYHSLIYIMDADGTDEVIIPSDPAAKVPPDDPFANPYDRISSHPWVSASAP